MRTLVQVSFPTEATNKALSQPDGLAKFKQHVDNLKAEAVYFAANDMGERSLFAVIDLADPSKIPVIAEPFFMTYQARVRLRPVMNWAETEKGVNEVMKMMPR